MLQQRWRICEKLNIQLSKTWVLKLHKQTWEYKKKLTAVEVNTWWTICQNSSWFKLYKCRYPFQLIKFSIFNNIQL